MERLIQLDNLNRQEALRYLGSGGVYGIDERL